MLCSSCGESLSLLPVLADSVPAEEKLCALCRRVPPPFRRAVAFGAYRDTLRSLIHCLKYDGMHPVARVLGSRLAEIILTLEQETPRKMLVVPVPLHTSKRRQRRFNQATLLASAAIRVIRQVRPSWELKLSPGFLERQRATASQAGLSPRQRRNNLRGAFFVPPGRDLEGEDILLIDDIYTTGATARACSKALLSAGANAVWVATLARAQRDEPVAAPAEIELPMQEDVAFWDSRVTQEAALLH